jgi:hypothetical protein
MQDSDPDPDSMNPNTLHLMQQCGYGSRKANMGPEKEKNDSKSSFFTLEDWKLLLEHVTYMEV